MSGEGGTGSALELVKCNLSELPSCLCASTYSEEGSGRRKRVSNEPDISPEEVFLCTWRRILSCEPTLIDRLIRRSRIAIKMGPKRVNKPSANGSSGVKRKREPDACTSSGPAKKMKVNPSKGIGGKGKKKLTGKAGPKNMGKKGQKKNTNRVSARLSSSKAKTPPCSLRSGRTLADIIKKKRMKATNSNTSEDANSIDDSPAEESVSKKAPKKVMAKPQQLNTAKALLRKNGNKSEGGASGSDDPEMKKQRRKRKKRDSMWVRAKRPLKKKDLSIQEGADEEEESSGEDEDDDDDNGQISDVSMVSSATQDSGLLSRKIKTEILSDSSLSKTEDVPKATIVVRQSTDDAFACCDNLPMEVARLNSDKKLDTVDSLNNIVIGNDEVKTEDSKVVTTIKSEDGLDSIDGFVVEKSSLCVKEETSMAVAPVNEGSSSSATDCAEVKNELVSDDSEELEGNKENICCVVNTKTCDSGSEPGGVSDPHPLDAEAVEEPPQIKDTFSLRTDSTPKAADGTIQMTDVKSLSRDGDASALQNDGSLCPAVGSDACRNDSTERSCAPNSVPLPEKESTILPNENRLPSTNGNAVKNLEDSKPDADSTTCDNPTTTLDDSFGDLSLRLSEDDLVTDKEHDEAMPDSTNASQDQAVPLTTLSDSLKALVDAEGTVTVKSEILEDPVRSCREESLEDLTEEQKQRKESMLQAIGLQPLSSASGEALEEKPPKRSDGYTGTLKAVIKLNRTGDKKHMVYKRTEGDLASSDKLEYRICSKTSSGEPVSDDRKIASSEHSEASDDDEEGISKEPKLIIPEKSSSFSIHPDRLCSDVCSYCFGKFGSLDTPCHVAQLKGDERQRKILENEPHLTGESCLCDACYRFVDRKANFPEKLRVGKLKPPAQASTCCVTHCEEPATRTIKRKWLIKLKKSITNKLDIDIDKMGHGVYYPLCTQHHYWVEYFTVCGICRKRLNRNNLFSLGAEADRLNLMLAEDGIPARLSVNLFLCKLCRYYADLRLKYPDPNAIPCSNQPFYKNYRRKILISLDMPVSDSEDELIQPVKEPMKMEGGRDDGKNPDDVMSLSGLATLLGDQPQQQARIQVKFGNVNIGTLSNLNIGQQAGSSASTSTSAARTAPTTSAHASSNLNGASASHSNESTYPDIALIANLEYQGPNTPDGSWERYNSTLQFDKKTKQLWTELQRPYGSQTSFLRHLVMLERVWRDGYLVLAPEADEAASRYITSARNRIRAFETQPPKMSKIVPTPAPKVPSPVPPPPNSNPAPSPAAVVSQVATAVRVPISSTTSVSRPAPNITVRKLQTPSTVTHPFPLLPNTGEIEVTTIRAAKPTPSVQKPIVVTSTAQPSQPRIISTASLSTGQMGQQIPHLPSQQRPRLQMINQQQLKKLTPLDRAKSLVRMAPMYQQIQQHSTQADKRAPASDVRFPGNKALNFIPPLVRLPQMQPTHFYQPPLQGLHQQQQQQQQQHIIQQINQHAFFQSQQQQRMAIPKLPRNLTVMSMPARSSGPQAITLSHAGITIEKQSAPSTSRSSALPIERPSISVFREPTTP
ncbi:Hypothetical protein NTJ_05769 [Nesidiocoris tenuis]|uniref:Uncharacterized protein n=1 Tax=Nesidiocoris tenuis TaxID=355587 RepID=A0ABN7ANF5_9HEMI|nr:Hypothetical protein NTJ_05769 [Nesidiocoris tenuis]